jgi:hypothetical protein
MFFRIPLKTEHNKPDFNTTLIDPHLKTTRTVISFNIQLGFMIKVDNDYFRFHLNLVKVSSMIIVLTLNVMHVPTVVSYSVFRADSKYVICLWVRAKAMMILHGLTFCEIVVKSWLVDNFMNSTHFSILTMVPIVWNWAESRTCFRFEATSILTKIFKL